jgi:hypothetical protein
MRIAFVLALAACGAGMSGYDASQYKNETKSTDVDPEIAPLPRGPKRWMLDPKSPLDGGAD